MSKLWQKSGKSLNPFIEIYTVGDDYITDRTLMPFDILGTKAHIIGLEKIGILSKKELTKALIYLKKLEKDFKRGKVKITVKDEDCHTVIENYLTKKSKKLGQKIHTGRSRNDQVLTALRLFMKEQLELIRKEAKKLAKNFLIFAQKNKNVPFPGYSHTKQAMLSSLGHYYLSFTESLIDDIEFLNAIDNQINKNPLGSAAGFGVPLLLDRELTTQELGFKKIQINSLYCQNSRGKFESLFMEGLVQIMLTLGKFATDLLLFTSTEFDFFRVKNNLVTGSSIMPQKKNLDAMEILRGNVSRVINNQHLIQDLAKGLISGYNRDFQLMKKPVIESTNIAFNSLLVVGIYLNGIEPKERTIQNKISKEIFAADIAITKAAKKGIPFRKTYMQAMTDLKKYKPDFAANIKSKRSLGAPGNLDFHYYKERLNFLSRPF